MAWRGFTEAGSGQGRAAVVARVVRAGMFLVVAVYLVSLIPGVRDHNRSSWFWDVGLTPGIFLLAATVCLLRSFSVAADRAAWACIGIGLISYAGGALWWYQFLEGQAEIPYPSMADALWLVLYPLAILGLVLMTRARMAGSTASMWLDGLVSGLSLASVSAAFIFPRIVGEASGSVAAVVTNTAYPLLDLALVATAVGAMATLGLWRDRSWLYLALGFFVFAAFDSWYLLEIADNTYHVGNLVDGGYPVAVCFVVLAADLRAAPETGPGSGEAVAPTENRSFLLPGLFSVLALGVLIAGDRVTISTFGMVLAGTAVLAAGARIALAVREMVKLSDSRRQAYTDALTGLPNRRAFYELVESAAGAVETTPGASGGSDDVSVLLIDLDRFKEINDALGHEVGDRVLRSVCQRFAVMVPAGGTIARLGGDEIAMLIPGGPTEQGVAFARHLTEALTSPFVIQGTSLHIDASIGITALETDTGAGKILAKADLAMYRAKTSRSSWEIYDDDRDGQSWDRLATMEALRQALSNDDLSIAFQPLVSAVTGRPQSTEALIRWVHAERGNIPPDSFLPMAERAGLMPAITRRILDLALDEAQRLRELGHSIPVAVNLSASDLLDGSLIHFVSANLQRRGLPGKVLRIEITESLLIDGNDAVAFLGRLRELDIELAVDDYGTGYSCLAYLHNLPVSYLKIDREFTSRVLQDEKTATIVASTIDMAHALGLKIVAEGVETVDQRDWLAEHRCDLIQGYLTGRPMPSEQLHEWLTTHPTLRDDVHATPGPPGLHA
jgi:diguanylate cyclase (GGDEF)-like protein